MTTPVFIDNKSHTLVLGTSFRPSGSTAFHTARYDFKPASVDNQREGILEIGDGNEVTVSLPNVQGTRTPCTVYKGNKRPVQKECVLIYDKNTGEFTLERVTSQIAVKKIRDSGNGNFSSNPILTPVAPRMPKHSSKKPSKSTGTKPLEKKSDVRVKHKEVPSGSTSTSYISTNRQRHIPAASEELLSADDGQSSDGEDSASGNDVDASSSDESEILPNLSNFPSQLQDDLMLSASSDDSD